MATPATASVRRLYTQRAGLYRRFFINLLGLEKKLTSFVTSHDYLRPDMKVLDAGCGTGIVTQVLHRQAQRQGVAGTEFFAFDLTPEMLEPFFAWRRHHAIDNVSITQADVTEPQSLPQDWRDFDLIVCASLFEHVPKEAVGQALASLQSRLRPTGRLLAIVTRRTLLTIPLIDWWWHAQVFSEDEIRELFEQAGFSVTIEPFGRRWFSSTMVVDAAQTMTP